MEQLILMAVLVLHIVSQKKKATVSLEAIQVTEMQMGHLFTQDLNQLGFY